MDMLQCSYCSFPDMKESFSYNLDEGTLWPEPGTAPSNFRANLESYLNAVNGLAQRLLGLFAIAIDLPESYFDDTYPPSGAGVRTLRYPPQRPQDVDEEVGIGAHTDSGWFTLVAQDTIGGLEIQNANGEWIPAVPQPGQFVVNIGDSMQWISNGKYSSTRHRVVNRRDHARHSMAFFKSPNKESVLKVAPTCRVEGETYQELVFKDYAAMRARGSRYKHPEVAGKEKLVVDGLSTSKVAA